MAVMLHRGSGARKLAVPFGPFLALGGIVALLAGDQLLDLYLNAFVR
jgi:leader peptidase (prepilin peptidase) / N-methyltransferase